MSVVYGVMIVSEQPYYSEVLEQLFEHIEDAESYSEFMRETLSQSGIQAKIIVEEFEVREHLDDQFEDEETK